MAVGNLLKCVTLSCSAIDLKLRLTRIEQRLNELGADLNEQFGQYKQIILTGFLDQIKKGIIMGSSFYWLE